MFGTSELAIATVLAGYMGGLAAGAAAAGKLAERIRRPVRVYGLLELGIALTALAVPFAIRLARLVYVALFAAEGTQAPASGAAAALFTLASSLAILMVPTALMGATLPLLARHAVRSDREIGSRVGALYTANTFGAVGGTLVAGFSLLPSLGLRGTVWVAVATNAAVFALAVLLARGAAPVTSPDREKGRSRVESTGGARRWILPLMAVSGAVSFGYEVLWSRLLGHILGGSVYAFATMLATFLTGIGLGAWLAARLARDVDRAARGFAWAQIGTGALSLAAFHALDGLPLLVRSLDASGGGRMLADAAAAAVVLLPGAICIGTTFPFAVRVLAVASEDAATASARVYAWNTVGAIAGAVGAGFWLLPALGFDGLVTLAIATNVLVSLLGAVLLPIRATRAGWVAAVCFSLLALLKPDPPWTLLRCSPLQMAPFGGQMIFLGVGRSATVLLREEQGSLRLTTNGLPESVIHVSGARPSINRVSAWLGSVATLLRPEARSALVVGLGGGLVLESVPEVLERIVVVEIEPEVVHANRAIADFRRRDPLADPRVEVRMGDARSELMLAPERYDAIISQPSHPWTAGSSHLYTREFFELASSRLTQDGVFVQWMGVAYIDHALLRSLVATMADVFPHVALLQPSSAAVLFVGSREPLRPARDAARAIARSPEHFALLGVQTPEDAAAVLALDDAGARAFARGAPLITDDRNLIQMRSPAVSLSDERLDASAAFVLDDPLVTPDWTDQRLDWAYLVRRLVSLGFPQRALRVASALPDPLERALAIGIVRISTGDMQSGVRQLSKVLHDDPGNVAARFALLRVDRFTGSFRDPTRRAQLERGLPDPEAAVIEGWRVDSDAPGGWRALAALDERLAVAGPRDPAYGPAVRLRVDWRLRSGDPERGREAVALMDRMLPIAGSTLRDILLRARAAAAAGDPRSAVSGLFELAGRLRRQEDHRRFARDGLALLAELPATELNPVVAARLGRIFERAESARPGGEAPDAAPPGVSGEAGSGDGAPRDPP